MEKTNIGFAVTGSFCTHEKILQSIQSLVKEGHEVFPIVSEITATTSTRFGQVDKFLMDLEKITGHKPFDSIASVEPTGPQNLFEVLVVAPCTGNTLAKIANGINDTAVTMAVKAHVRNNKPVVIGISTNDGLGLNLKNIGTLLAAKNFYFVPFGQDDHKNKPKSLVADWKALAKTIEAAKTQRQIEPVLI